jgi:hypothetical protein
LSRRSPTGDDDFGAGDVLRAVSLERWWRPFGQPLGDAPLQVGAGDLVAEVQQHLGDAAHADAADADEMDALNFCKHAGIAEESFCFLKVHRSSAYISGHHAICESGNKIRFESQSRNSHQQSRYHARAGGVTTYADDHIWSKLSEHPSAGKHGPRNVGKRSRTTSQADALQLPYLHELQLESGVGNQPSLDATRCA